MAVLSLNIKLTTGEAYDVNVTPKVIVECERHFAKAMSDIFGESASYEALAWAGWKASALAGRTGKDFDTWLNDLDEIDPAEEQRVPLETP